VFLGTEEKLSFFIKLLKKHGREKEIMPTQLLLPHT
jgi:hypothetical protein